MRISVPRLRCPESLNQAGVVGREQESSAKTKSRTPSASGSLSIQQPPIIGSKASSPRHHHKVRANPQVVAACHQTTGAAERADGKLKRAYLRRTAGQHALRRKLHAMRQRAGTRDKRVDVLRDSATRDGQRRVVIQAIPTHGQRRRIDAERRAIAGDCQRKRRIPYAPQLSVARTTTV